MCLLSTIPPEAVYNEALWVNGTIPQIKKETIISTNYWQKIDDGISKLISASKFWSMAKQNNLYLLPSGRVNEYSYMIKLFFLEYIKYGNKNVLCDWLLYPKKQV